MKKPLVILAALAASGAAMAQSSVTVFGIVDTSLAKVQGDGKGSRIGLATGSNATSRLGFRGTEDLGGGLAAGFWLEGALQADEGTPAGLLFQRRSTVSLSGNFGELRLGRDFTSSYRNNAAFDVWGNRGIGTGATYDNLGYSTVRASNGITYFLPPTLGGVYGEAEYSFGEKQSNTANDKQSNYLGGRIGYAAGPLNVATSYGKFKQVIGASDTAPVTIGKDLTHFNLAGWWDFGVVKPMVIYSQEKVKNGVKGAAQMNAIEISASAPIGAGELRGSVERNKFNDSANGFNKFALGYGYNLSKRTQLYGTVARIDNKGVFTKALSAEGLATTGVNPGGRSSGFEVGIRHIF
ncbi:MAG: porin [Pseudomonadota bacterium]